MKLKFKNILVVGCLTMVSVSNSFGQFAQYQEPAAKISNNNSYCTCEIVGPFNAPDVAYSYTLGIIESIWGGLNSRKNESNFVRDMESSFKKEIEQELGKNFNKYSEAEAAFFEEYSKSGRLDSTKEFASETDDFVKDFNLAADELKALDQRETELQSGNIDDPYLGEFYANGKSLGSLKTIDELKNLREEVLSKYNGLNNHINRNGKSNIYEGSRKMRYSDFDVSKTLSGKYKKFLDNAFWNVSSQYFVNLMRDYIMAYRARNFQENKFCGTPYDGSQCPEGSIYNDLVSNGRLYNIEIKDAAFETAVNLGQGQTPYTPRTRSLESLRNESAITNLGSEAVSYINNNAGVKQAVSKYFDHYDFNKASQDCVNYLFQNVLGDGNFAPNQADYEANGTPKCRGASEQNTAIDMEWKPSSIELGYQGFQNIMAELNNIPENNQKIGHVIKNLLSANGKGLPNWMTDALAGEYFNFRLVPADARGVQIDFRDGYGNTAWDDGLRDNNAIYEHIRRVDFVGVKLGLDQLQINVLLDASSFVKELFDFLNENEDNPSAIDFGKEAVGVFNEGGDVDFDCNDPKPDKLSFCAGDPFVKTNLTPEQEEKLQNAIDQLQATCLGQALISSVEEVNVAVGDLTPGAAAQYEATTNTIKFSANSVGNALGEELFHAYQQQLYGILVDISKPSTGHIGGSNIEFEEKAFTMLSGWIEYNRDLDKFFEQNSTGIFAMSTPATYPDTELLNVWSDNLVLNHFKSDSPITFSSAELSKWFEALDNFQSYHFEANGCGITDVYGCPVNTSIKPDALLNIFNEAINNCN